MTLSDKLTHLRSVCEKATKGPWTVDCGETIAFIPDEGELCVLMEHGNGFATEDDYRFSATARNEWSGLLEALEIASKSLNGLVDFNRTRGYPTGMEWMVLVEAHKQALTRINEALGTGTEKER